MFFAGPGRIFSDGLFAPNSLMAKIIRCKVMIPPRQGAAECAQYPSVRNDPEVIEWKN